MDKSWCCNVPCFKTIIKFTSKFTLDSYFLIYHNWPLLNPLKFYLKGINTRKKKE